VWVVMAVLAVANGVFRETLLVAPMLFGRVLAD
jgi:hypothetical protein